MKQPAKPDHAQRILKLMGEAISRAELFGDRAVWLSREDAAEILRAAGELKPAEVSK